ncbi:MAG TPA: hypothetical protein VMK12_21230 [Anaeromyxobacteraceae bacterium]|nr:hypothetical protein [Anaeromyxobacteraceae bacterium]
MSPVLAADDLVSVAYVLAELLGSEKEARGWLRSLRDGADADDAIPAELSYDNRAILLGRLQAAGVIVDGSVDAYWASQLDQVMQVIPLVRAAETARLPAQRPRLVCTLPFEAAALLPASRRNFGKSLANLVLDALRSARSDGVLIASPYWSTVGCARLRPALDRARTRELPVVLAGAREVDATHHGAMVRFGRDLREDGAGVRVLTFLPPRATSLFHAKLVCGETGYLGSGNVTAAGLESHVEVGMPLTPIDVAEAWYIIGELERVGLLVPAAL